MLAKLWSFFRKPKPWPRDRRPASIEELIQYFESKPENLWNTGSYHDEAKERFCALGWLYTDFGAIDFVYSILPVGTVLTEVNDGRAPEYKGRTPKRRVINFLKTQKAK